MKKIFIAAAAATMLFGGATAPMFAQLGGGNNTPVSSKVAVATGTVIICHVSIGSPIVRVNLNPQDPGGLNGNGPDGGDGGNDGGNITGSGDASFESISSETTPVAKTTFKPTELTFSGTDPVYGAFSFSFDASRTPSNTTVVANQAGADFPATANVYAYVTGTVAGLPGTYTNSTECHISTSNLRSFNPQVGETYTFDNDVVFTNQNDPTAPTFTIAAGSSVTMN